ncbi:hypothetical protein KR200_008171 [Drosophila serrata]|nr:hypothetical protein KR200_008171 [Drosophila serrata]
MNNGTLVYCNLKGPMMLNMTSYRDPLSKMFNNVRNEVAGGHYRNLPQAARMAKMSWSDELAWFAHLDVVLCRKTTHHCHTSPYFYYIGVLTEEVFKNYGEDTATNLDIMNEVIEYWKSGIGMIDRKYTLHLPQAFDKASTFRASLLINERNSHFGCATIYFKNNDHFIFSCAFATANIVGMPVYKWGLKPGIKCHRRDKYYKNLCAIGEKYNNHKSFYSAEVITEE